MRGLVGGIPYEQLGDASLIKIQLMYLAAMHKEELAARTDVELKMTDVSARELGKARRVRDDGDPKDKRDDEEKAQDEADEERGKELLPDYRLSLEFPTWSPHRQAAYVRRYGWPNETPQARVLPYRGMTRVVAAEMLALIDAGKIDARFPDVFERAASNITDRLKATATPPQQD